MRLFTLLLSVLISSTTFAQLNGDGYYRVKSAQTKRYLFLMDNTGEINVSSASADVAAIVPYSDFRDNSKGKEVISDPATIIYVKSISGGYKFSAQGASTTDIIGEYPIQIMDKGNNTYWCYATKSSTTMYLADTQTSSRYPNGTLQTIGPSDDQSGNLRKWFIMPVAKDGDNYFGVKPTFSANGKYYASFYADFPFTFASSGMKAYTVTEYKKNKAVLTEITSSVLPAKTPMLIECSSEDPANNKLNIGGEAAAVNTVLKGNFFCYDANPNNTGEPHENLTPVTSTMRVFGVTANGKLGLVTPSGMTNLPANCAYFNANNIDSELVLMSKEEYIASEYVDVTAVSLNTNELSLDLNGNATATLVATIAPNNATDKTLTWSSSNENVATVTQDAANANKVIVTAKAVGEAVITVKSTNGKTATCKVTVVDTTPIEVTNITLSATELSLDLNGNATATLVATIAPNNATDKTLTWSSSNENVATVTNGVVTAKAVGEAVITVKSTNGKTATCKVTVVDTTTIEVANVTLNTTELSLDLNGNATATLVATIAPANATDKTLTWSSSNENVATVNNGVVTAKSVGEAVITVKSTNGKTATCKVTVVDTTPIEVANVTLNTTELSLDLNGNATATLVATIAPANATDKTVTWSSSNEAVAIVNNGVVTAKAVGEAVITVKSTNGKTATCKVTVVDTTPIEVANVTLNTTELSLDLNGNATATLVATIAPDNATDKTVTWSSSNESVVTVSNGVATDNDATNSCVVTAKAVGEAIITVTSTNGKTATCKVTVDDTSAIEYVSAEKKAKNSNVYTVNGTFVGNDLNAQPNGLYIKNSKKVLRKK